ncbi:hypothetical protein CDEF62S_01955 [Castellaniella defragrans]
MRRDLPDQIEIRPPAFGSGRYVEQGKLINLFGIEDPDRIDRVANIAMIGELHALHQALPPKQQSGYHPDSQHVSPRKFCRSLMPNLWLFSG